MGVAYNPSIVTNGLVLCLDAGNTKSYPGSGTTWTDLSGNGNNGTLTNGLQYYNDGYLNFDGFDDNNWFWGGRIAQTQIYNRALTASEVQQNFNANRSRYGI